MADDYRSVLERQAVLQRDMSSPEYRARLTKQQALEGSYPELMLGGLGALARQGATAVRGMFGGRQAAPVFTEYQIAEMQRQAAFNSLTKDELAAFNKSGVFPADWAERVKNASYIGSSAGKVSMPGAVKRSPQEQFDRLNKNIAEQVLIPTGRRVSTDAAVQTGNQMKDIYDRQRQPTQEEVVQMLRGYAYGGLIPQAGNNKLI